MLHNVADLLNSGVGFTIVEADAQFGEDGELSGYSVITNEHYTPPEPWVEDWMNELEVEPLCDTTSLSDDTDRWGHLADSHIEDRLSCALDTGGGYDRHLEYSSLARDNRVRELTRWVKRVKHELSFARRKKNTLRVCELERKLKAAKQGINKRYFDAIHLIVTRKRNEWWMLYLTKQQRVEILDLIDRR